MSADKVREHTSVIVREATPRDVAPCVALAAKASGRGVREWRARLRDDLERADRLLLVAEAGRDLVGYGRARRFDPGRDAASDVAPAGHYLLGLFVEPELRRRGIARALTEMRLAWIQRRAASAWFFTNAQNTASIELHRAFGFVEVTRAFSFPRVTFEAPTSLRSGRGDAAAERLSGTASAPRPHFRIPSPTPSHAPDAQIHDARPELPEGACWTVVLFVGRSRRLSRAQSGGR